MFEKLKRKHQYKQAAAYLKNVDYADLVQTSDKVRSYCIDEEYEAFGGVKAYSHHLPLKDKDKAFLLKDNWNITEAKAAEIEQALKILEKYSNAMINVCFYDKDGTVRCPSAAQSFICEVLPPWIVFPHYDAMTIGWRMGDGEAYMECFISYLEMLSREQKEAYFKTYPVPEYMEVNRFAFNFANHQARNG